MRILFLNNYFYLRGGSERALFEEIGLLNGEGHETAVFSRTHKLNEASKYDSCFPPDIDTERRALAFKTIATAREILYSESARRGLTRVIDDFGPDVAHIHNAYGRLSLSALDALKEKGIPTVMTLHDYKLLCPNYLMLNHGELCERCRGRRFYNAFLTKCHKDSYAASAVYAIESWLGRRTGKYDSLRTLVSPSRFLKNKMIEHGWNAERIAYVPNFTANGFQSSLDGGPGSYLLYFGRLSPEKGVLTLLEALSGIDRVLPAVIAGDGPERPRLQAAAERKGLATTFVGYLSGKDLENTIAGARFVVLPSECYENAPLSLLETLARGKPVIASRIGGIPEIIDDETNGFLFESRNIEDFRAKLKKMMNLPDSKIREMGVAARKKAMKEYNPGLHYERLMAVYRSALAKR